MNKQDLLKYLELKNVGRTLFEWEEQTYTVKDAPPGIFDQWIRQYVEEIINVDTFLWDIFDRWQIINAVLKAGILHLEEMPNGTFFFRIERKAELKSSELELEAEEKSS